MKTVPVYNAFKDQPETIQKRWVATRTIVSSPHADVLSFIQLFVCQLILLTVPAAMADAAENDVSTQICVTDDMSRQVCVSRYPKRIVSLAPSLTEIVFDLGKGDALVGRTALCNEPPAALKVRDVGGYLTPDLERMIALRPDLVLSPENGMRKEIVERLTELEIPVFVDNSSTLDEITHLIGTLGTFLGKKADAKALIEKFQERRKAVWERVASQRKPTILFCVGVDPLVVAGGKTFIGSLIREAGGINAAERAAIPYPKFSMEEVVRNDPEIIVVLNKDCKDKECFDRWRRHQALKAVRSGRIYQLNADLVARPAPKIMDAFEQLAAILHPDVFGKSLSVGVRSFK